MVVLSLVMNDCWDLLPVGFVPFMYMVTGEFPYAWPSNLFRSTLCRIRIWLRESSIYVGFGSVPFDSVSLMYSVRCYDFSYWALAHSVMFKCR